MASVAPAESVHTYRTAVSTANPADTVTLGARPGIAPGDLSVIPPSSRSSHATPRRPGSVPDLTGMRSAGSVNSGGVLRATLYVRASDTGGCTPSSHSSSTGKVPGTAVDRVTLGVISSGPDSSEHSTPYSTSPPTASVTVSGTGSANDGGTSPGGAATVTARVTRSARFESSSSHSYLTTYVPTLSPTMSPPTSASLPLLSESRQAAPGSAYPVPCGMDASPPPRFVPSASTRSRGMMEMIGSVGMTVWVAESELPASSSHV